MGSKNSKSRPAIDRLEQAAMKIFQAASDCREDQPSSSTIEADELDAAEREGETTPWWQRKKRRRSRGRRRRQKAGVRAVVVTPPEDPGLGPSPSEREWGSISMIHEMTLKQAPRRVSERFDRRVTGKYEIEALIGKGSFSRVVRARLRGAEGETASEACAIKVVPADDASSGPFANELEILSSLRHPFVIRLHEAFRSTAKFYLVLEEATGGELYDKIVKYGTLSEQTSVTTTRMLLSGLQYLHRVGVTHRDLKPENLLFIQPTDDSRLVISDFGLAHQQQPGEGLRRFAAAGSPQPVRRGEPSHFAR